MSTPADLIALGCTRSYVRGERPGWHYRREDGTFECWDTWLIPHAVLVRALELINGKVEVIGGTAARIVPLTNTDFSNAICYDAQGDADGWNRSTSTQYLHRAKLLYHIPPYPLTGSDAYMRKNTAPGVRAMQLPPALTNLPAWTTDNIPTTIYQFELVNLASIDVPSLTAYGGYRNTDTWRGFGPGTVKFIPPTSFEQRTVAGGRQYSATYGFEVCRVPWDQEYNEAGTLVSINYPPGTSFSTLFGF